MASECSEDAIPTGRGFLNHVDPIGRAVQLIYSLALLLFDYLGVDTMYI